MAVYQTWLINFGLLKYEGTDLDEAKAAALRAGFEATILEDGSPLLSWSPVGGWRGTR